MSSTGKKKEVDKKKEKEKNKKADATVTMTTLHVAEKGAGLSPGDMTGSSSGDTITTSTTSQPPGGLSVDMTQSQGDHWFENALGAAELSTR